MADFDIRFPIRGLSDDVAYSEQEPGTTSDALNVRGLDPVTGRERGAQREGLSKFCADGQALTGKVNALMSVSYDLRNITYSTVSTADETDAIWSYTTSTGGPCYGLSLDTQENVFCLNGDTGIVKLNSDGKKVWEHGIKVVSKGQKLRSIQVDYQGGVFVASGEGGDQEDAAIWRVVEVVNLEDEPEPEDDWTVKPGGFIKHLAYKFGSLYAAIDKPDDGRSEIVVYSQAASASPVEVTRYSVPYPVNHVTVDDKGFMVVSCPRNEDRGFEVSGAMKVGIHPSSPESTVSTVGWNPKDLDDWEKRVWFWMDGNELDYTAEQQPEVGEEVTFVRSKDKNERNLYPNSIKAADFGPTVVKSLAGLKAISFNGLDQSLISGPAVTNTKAQASAQQTSFPAYEGGMFAACILIRPTKESDTASPEGKGRGTLFAQLVRGGNAYGDSDTQLGYGYLSLVTNSADYSFLSPATSIGRILYTSHAFTEAGGTSTYEETTTPTEYYDWSRHTSAGTGVNKLSNHSQLYSATHEQTPSRGIKDEYYNFGAYQGEEDWEESDEAVLITIIHDGSVDSQEVGNTAGVPWEGPTSGKTRALIRINGVPIDRWTDRTLKCSADSFTAWGSGADNGTGVDTTASHFSGEILEVVVLDRKDRNDDTTEPKVLTHPEDPDYLKSVSLSSGGTGYSAGTLRAIIQAGTTSACGGANQPWTGSSRFGSSGTAGMADWIAWVEIGTYTVSGGVIDSITLYDTPELSESGWGWMNVPAVVPSDEAALFGGGGSGATFDVSIHEDYSGSSVLDDDTTELEKLEGYLVHKWGCPNILPDSTDRWAHPYWNKVPQAAKADGTYGGDINELVQAGPIVARYDASGDLVWAHGDDNGVSPRCGLAAAVMSDGRVATIGERPELGSFQGVSIIAEDGQSSSAADVFAEEITGGDIAVGEFDEIFYARAHDSANADNKTVTGISQSKFALYDLDIDEDAGDDARDAYSVALAPFSPDYGDDISSLLYRSQYVYVATSDVRNDGTTGQPNVYKFRTVSVAPNSNPPRGHSNFAVGSDGELKSFTAGGTLDNLTTGDESPDFTASSTFIDWTSLFNKVYVTDGQIVKVIDPVKDTVEALEPDDGGKLPENPRLIAAWRGRLVMARLADDPHAYVMSEKDNPKGWNTDPIEDSSTAATAGSLSLAGKPQDVINTLIPYSDDILIMGCDSSIWTLTGDPLLGGQIDLVTDVTGMAFGRPWCKDPRGNIFFFGSRGGVYVMPPTGGAPEKITEASIDRRMSDVDLGTYRIELVWNERQEGLHVLQVPYGAGGSAVRHWFWDRKRNAWWEDEFGDTTVQPTAALVIDGDTVDDRVMLLGGEDGVIRQFDESATDDDGFGIEARVLFGPIVPKEGEGKEVRFSHLAVTLASEQDGAMVQTYISDTADEKGPHFSQDDMSPGRNPYLTRKVKGGYYWVQLLNANPNERWAFEAMSVRAYPAGRRRAR